MKKKMTPMRKMSLGGPGGLAKPGLDMMTNGGPFKFSDPNVGGAISAGGNLGAGLIDAIDSGDRFGVRSGAGSAASGALKGAAAGAALGPIGAGVGAAIGLATSLIGNNKAKKARTVALQNEASSRAFKENQLSTQIMAEDPTRISGRQDAQMYKLGGPLKVKKMRDGGPVANPTPKKTLAAKDRAFWNGFVDHVEKKGYKGSTKLDQRDTNLSRQLFDEYAAGQNYKYDDFVPQVQQSISEYRNVAIEQIKAGKAHWPGYKNDNNFDGFMKGLSNQDGWAGSKTTSWRFPDEKIRGVPDTPNDIYKVLENKKYGGTLKGSNPTTRFTLPTAKANVPTVDLLPDVSIRPKRIMRNGGLMPLSSGAAEVKGPSHEKGGVKFPELGVELEGGETVANGFVYSKKLGFADKHKPIAKAIGAVEQMPNSPNKQATLDMLASKEQALAVAQENLKAKSGIKSKPVMRDGGSLKKMRDGGNVDDVNALMEELRKKRQAIDRDYIKNGSNKTHATLEKTKQAQLARISALEKEILKLSEQAKTETANYRTGDVLRTTPQNTLNTIKYRMKELNRVSNAYTLMTPDNFDEDEKFGFYRDSKGSLRFDIFPNTQAMPKNNAGLERSKFGTVNNVQIYEADITGKGAVPKTSQVVKGINASATTLRPDKKEKVNNRRNPKTPVIPAVLEERQTLPADLQAKTTRSIGGPKTDFATTIGNKMIAKEAEKMNAWENKIAEAGKQQQEAADAKAAKSAKLGQIVDGVTPFISNISNAFRRLPLPPRGTEQAGITPALVNYDADRAEAIRQRRGADKVATESLNGGNAAAATRAANMTQSIRAMNSINQAESNANVGIKNQALQTNATIAANNNAKTDLYNTQLVERQLKAQELKAENLADMGNKSQLLSRDRKMFDLEQDKIMLEIGDDPTGAKFRTMGSFIKKRYPGSYKKLEVLAMERERLFKEEQRARIAAEKTKTTTPTFPATK